jgi:hypothetical protein
LLWVAIQSHLLGDYKTDLRLSYKFEILWIS